MRVADIRPRRDRQLRYKLRFTTSAPPRTIGTRVLDGTMTRAEATAELAKELAVNRDPLICGGYVEEIEEGKR